MRKLAIFLILLAASIGYATSEIQIGYKSGNTLYALVRKHSDSTVWNDSNSAWETWVDAYVPDYNIAMADGDGDFYKADFPSGISAGLYPINVYLRQGDDPNNDNDILVGTGQIVWDGTAEVTDYTSYTDRQTIIGDTNELETDWTDGGRLDTIIDSALTDTNDIQEDWATIVAQVADVNTDTDTIIADTNELETDWTNGGRLDVIIDSILADTNELETDWTNAGRLDAIIDLILGDSNELETDWTDGGRLDLILDAVLVDTNDTQEDWAALLVNIADIETDTNELETDWTDGGRLDVIIDDIQDTSGAGGF